MDSSFCVYHSFDQSTCKLNLDIYWDFITMKDIDKVYMCTMSYYKPGSAVVQSCKMPIKHVLFFNFLINGFDEGSIL